jgi:hypothetical protein
MQARESNETMFQALEPIAGYVGRMVKLMRFVTEGVKPADVAELRAMVEAAGGLTRSEADALVSVEASRAPKCDEWSAFFIDAITDHVVWHSRPTGVVNESQGEWLIAMTDRCATPASLGALANVAAEAHRLPLWFVAAVRARLARRGEGALERVA